jgi:hypothetical protein
MSILKVIFWLMCITCGVLKFFNVTIGGKTASGGTWSLDLFQGFFLFGFLALAPWPF